MDITFVNCIQSDNVGANDKKQLKEVSPRLLAKVKEKEDKYVATATRMHQIFEAVVIAHSGQWSSGAIRMLELGVRKYAEKQGYPVGVVRGWWMLALCMEHAKGTAGMVLHAAAAMAEGRAGRPRVEGNRLDSCFRDDVANAREPAQFQRPLSEEELCAARSAAGSGGGLAGVFSWDMAAARLVPEMVEGGVDGAALAGLSEYSNVDLNGGAVELPSQEFVGGASQMEGIQMNPLCVW